MGDYKHILLAVDFTPEAEQVGQRALDLAERYSASLSMVHVVEPMILAPPYEMTPVVPEGLDKQLMAAAQDSLDKLAEKLGVREIARHLLHGPVKITLVEFAEQKGVDLVVLGSHSRHGFERLLGSTANAVLHAAPCDVLAVRFAH